MNQKKFLLYTDRGDATSTIYGSVPACAKVGFFHEDGDPALDRVDTDFSDEFIPDATDGVFDSFGNEFGKSYLLWKERVGKEN